MKKINILSNIQISLGFVSIILGLVILSLWIFLWNEKNIRASCQQLSQIQHDSIVHLRDSISKANVRHDYIHIQTYTVVSGGDKPGCRCESEQVDVTLVKNALKDKYGFYGGKTISLSDTIIVLK